MLLTASDVVCSSACMTRCLGTSLITLARQSGTRCQMNFEILTVLMAKKQFSKTIIFSCYLYDQHIRDFFNQMHYINLCFTYIAAQSGVVLTLF